MSERKTIRETQDLLDILWAVTTCRAPVDELIDRLHTLREKGWYNITHDIDYNFYIHRDRPETEEEYNAHITQQQQAKEARRKQWEELNREFKA